MKIIVKGWRSYDPEWDLKALSLRQLEQIPYVSDLVKRFNRNPISGGFATLTT